MRRGVFAGWDGDRPTKNLDATDELQFRADLVDEQIDTVSRAVLANSIACARCHDHKFDPFSMEDYYGLAGIFASTKTYFGTAVSPANRIGGVPLELPEVEGQKILHNSIPQKRVEQLQAELAELRAEKAEMDEARRAAFDGIFDASYELQPWWAHAAAQSRDSASTSVAAITANTVAARRALRSG
jgi:hypothetical protein